MATITISEAAESSCIDATASNDDGASTTTLVPRTFDITTEPLGYGGSADRWQGVHCLLGNCNGEQRDIVLARLGKFPSSSLAVQHAWFREGAGAWQQFANVSADATSITYSKGSAFADDTVEFCTTYPYWMSDLESDLDTWEASPLIHPTAASTAPTASGRAKLVVGTTSGSTMPWGSVVASQNLYAFRVGRSAAQPKKRALLMTARVHPGETHASIGIARAIERATALSAEWSAILDRCDVIVCPCMDPEGVAGWSFRSSPDSIDFNSNRLWNTANDGESANLDQWKTIIPAMLSGVDVIGHIDWHSIQSKVAAIGGKPYGYYFQNSSDIRRGMARVITYYWEQDYQEPGKYDVDGSDGDFVLDGNVDRDYDDPAYQGWLAHAGQSRFGAVTGMTMEMNADFTIAQANDYVDSFLIALQKYVQKVAPSFFSPWSEYVDQVLQPDLWIRFGAGTWYPFRGEKVGPGPLGPTVYVEGDSLVSDDGSDGSAVFDGNHSYQSDPGLKVEYGSAGGTIIAWVAMEKDGGDPWGRYFVGQWDSGSSGPYLGSHSFGLGFSMAGAAQYPSQWMWIKDSDGNGWEMGGGAPLFPAVDDGGYHQVALTWALNEIKIYLDGELVVDEAPTFDPAKFNPDLALRFGARGNDDGDRRWKGMIDEAMVFTRPLSAAEVAEIASFQQEESSGGSPSGPGYY